MPDGLTSKIMPELRQMVQRYVVWRTDVIKCNLHWTVHRYGLFELVHAQATLPTPNIISDERITAKN